MPARTRSRRRLGCFVVAGVVFLLLLFGGGAWLIATSQNRSEQPELAESTHVPAGTAVNGRVELEVAIARLIVLPADPGAPLRLDAEYDSRRFELDEAYETDDGGDWIYRLAFAPRGSRAWALFRVKAGADPPTLWLELPRGVRLTLDGVLVNGFGAIELGGLDVESSDLHVEAGGAGVSFRSPTAQPMEYFELSGDKGSIEVTGLGMASPKSVRLFQHLGELDVDLRGPWSRDAEVRITGKLAGGQVWLPDDVELRRGGRSVGAGPERELPRPILSLELNEHAGRLIVIDPNRPGEGAR